MGFTRDGVAGEITREIERAAGPGRVQVAMRERNGGRSVCILADATERYYDLDEGVTVEDFPALREGGFSPIPSHIARTSSSIFRSVAKRAIGYDRGRGDRIIVILCPRTEWPQLRLNWPP